MQFIKLIACMVPLLAPFKVLADDTPAFVSIPEVKYCNSKECGAVSLSCIKYKEDFKNDTMDTLVCRVVAASIPLSSSTDEEIIPNHDRKARLKHNISAKNHTKRQEFIQAGTGYDAEYDDETDLEPNDLCAYERSPETTKTVTVSTCLTTFAPVTGAPLVSESSSTSPTSASSTSPMAFHETSFGMSQSSMYPVPGNATAPKFGTGRAYNGKAYSTMSSSAGTIVKGADTVRILVLVFAVMVLFI